MQQGWCIDTSHMANVTRFVMIFVSVQVRELVYAWSTVCTRSQQVCILLYINFTEDFIRTISFKIDFTIQ